MRYFFKEICEASNTKLSYSELKEMQLYLNIYLENKFTKHHQVNQYIDDHDMWDEFKQIRTLNYHGGKKVRGISPQHYAIVCSVLNLTKHGKGAALEHFEEW
jgi:hypothetical protein